MIAFALSTPKNEAAAVERWTLSGGKIMGLKATYKLHGLYVQRRLKIFRKYDIYLDSRLYFEHLPISFEHQRQLYRARALFSRLYFESSIR